MMVLDSGALGFCMRNSFHLLVKSLSNSASRSAGIASLMVAINCPADCFVSLPLLISDMSRRVAIVMLRSMLASLSRSSRIVILLLNSSTGCSVGFVRKFRCGSTFSIQTLEYIFSSGRYRL